MARPRSAERQSAHPASAAPRGLVRGIGVEPAYVAEIDVRTAFDFVISLGVAPWGEEDILPEDRRRLEAARGQHSELFTDPVLFGTGTEKGVVAELNLLVADRPDVRTAADVVRLIESTEPRELLRSLVRDLCMTHSVAELADRAVGGEPGALEEFEARWRDISPDYPLPAVLAQPEATAHRLRAAARTLLPAYESIESRVAWMIQHDADDRREAMATTRADDFIEQTTGGLRWLAEPTVRRVILAPGYHNRPYNYLYGWPDHRLIVYPISDASLDAGDRLAPPAATVRLYRALGDETRLRVLRLLVDRDLYLTELAQALELSKPTMKHHLTQLRAAGLVTVTEEGGLTYYSLRRARTEEAGPELRRYLGI